MRIGKTFAGTILLGGLLSVASPALAAPPADDFLNAQKPGPRLTLMPFVGPGFRAIYDHRFEIEKDMSEVRTQLMGTVAIPFSEVSANIDARFFVMTFGASVGYHNEWHVLQFDADPATGRDMAGQGDPPENPNGYLNLDRDARAMKDQNADTKEDQWVWSEARWGFLWPAYNFMGVSTLAARHDGRPDMTYDWENGTVFNGGWHLRWEGYALFRERNTGFIGPAFRAVFVPRNRVDGDQTLVYTPPGAGQETTSFIVPDGADCLADSGVRCVQSYEFELHYGVLAGIRPNWVDSSDQLLVRAYTTWGLQNKYFGTQVFRQPLQILVAYMVDIGF